MSKCPVCGLTLADPPRCGAPELPDDTLEQPDERAIVPAINTNTTTPGDPWANGLWHASQPWGPVR